MAYGLYSSGLYSYGLCSYGLSSYCLPLCLNWCQRPQSWGYRSMGLCTCLCISLYTHVCTHVSVHMSVHMSAHMSAHMPVHTSVRTSVHMSVHMPVHMSVHTHPCPHTCLRGYIVSPLLICRCGLSSYGICSSGRQFTSSDLVALLDTRRAALSHTLLHPTVRVNDRAPSFLKISRSMPTADARMPAVDLKGA